MKKNKSEKRISKAKRRKLIRLISLGIVFGVMLAFLVGYIIGVTYNKQYSDNKLPAGTDNNLKEDVNDDNQQIDNDNNDIELAKEIYFLENDKGEKIISEVLDSKMKYLGKYTCQNLGCGYFYQIPSPTKEQQFFNNNLVLISDFDGDEDIAVLYNYKTNKIVDTYDDVLCSYEFENNNFSILVERNEKMGILNSSGNLLYNIELDEWGYRHIDSSPYEGVCLKNPSIYDKKDKTPGYDGVNGVLSKDGKYGVINFQTGEVVVPFKYEKLRLMYDGNYSVKEGNKWYLLNKKFEKIIKTGYDMIYSFNDVILVGTNIDENKTEYKLIDKNGTVLTNTIDIWTVPVDSYDKVSNGMIVVSGYAGGTFTYNLSKKTLSYKDFSL